MISNVLFHFKAEKRVALLTELSRLKGDGYAGSRGEAAQLTNGLEPCYGDVCISNLHLPLKAEFVSQALCKEGKGGIKCTENQMEKSHNFCFILVVDNIVLYQKLLLLS